MAGERSFGSLLAAGYRTLREKRLAFAGAVVIVAFVAVGIAAPIIAPHDPLEIDLRNALSVPSAEHWFGTDNNGRDILSRVLYGARTSLFVSLLSVGCATIAGVFIGAVAGYYAHLQAPLMRFVDIVLAFPSIMIALIIVAVLGTGTMNVIVAIAVAQTPQFARLVNAIVLATKEDMYVEAGRAIGETDSSLLWRYVIPACVPPVVVQISLLIPASIMTASALSFLGLGVQPPNPEWGAMLSLGKEWMRTAPHLMLFPGLALMVVVLGFNLLGEGLRDLLDPKLRYE